ncbi:hypothetical protein FHU36_008828 [Nonomuraea muscovyensis]|uniref:Uncharacterized protein n=1 Tax=Nonomuraea muscovyensis TaxID=1124761 RepID=A0A7X0F1B7_9ACTN|nr:hypothetical protein [Nonomuraea muscovyensis]MBB6352232.1 hypothetical protein [Nonomuraea muscovyensis]
MTPRADVESGCECGHGIVSTYDLAKTDRGSGALRERIADRLPATEEITKVIGRGDRPG